MIEKKVYRSITVKQNWILFIICLIQIFYLNCEKGVETSPQIVPSYSHFDTPDGVIKLTFSATSDMHYCVGDDISLFRGICERISAGGCGQFMITAGDFSPPQLAYNTIRNYIGENYLWYPVAGNHETIEAETPAYIEWLREYNRNGKSLPNIVRKGPPGCEETTYSFDYDDAHFIMLNEYFDGISDTGTDGDIVDRLYNWLIEDLMNNNKEIIYVVGHEPAYPQPDEETGRVRHEFDSLNKYQYHRDRFWNTLIEYNVLGYICGHTHNHSIININGVWHIELGHSKGMGETGTPSTFVMFYHLTDGKVWFYSYRLKISSDKYELKNYRQLK